jgi:hypothetical protein
VQNLGYAGYYKENWVVRYSGNLILALSFVPVENKANLLYEYYIRESRLKETYFI